MESIVRHTKEIIDLSGKIDFHIRNGNSDRVIENIKKMRNHLNIVQKFVNTHEVIK